MLNLIKRLPYARGSRLIRSFQQTGANIRVPTLNNRTCHLYPIFSTALKSHVNFNLHKRSFSTDYSTTTTTNEKEKCSWEEFFENRRTMRYYEIATGILTASLAFAGSTFYLFTIASFDPTGQFFGILDSYTLYLIAPGFVAVISYVVGLAAGSSIWRITRMKNTIASFDKCNKNFYNRITKFRAPNSANVSPIPNLSSPDYYGEKIFSAADYRKWLKKQRLLLRRRTLPR